jgi:hypothetical protein
MVPSPAGLVVAVTLWGLPENVRLRSPRVIVAVALAMTNVAVAGAA